MVLQIHINLDTQDSEGRTNLERMKSEKAPLGPDGKKTNPSHLNQEEDGVLAEITRRPKKITTVYTSEQQEGAAELTETNLMC